MFIHFLNSLKTPNNASLIETIQKGFRLVMIESELGFDRSDEDFFKLIDEALSSSGSDFDLYPGYSKNQDDEWNEECRFVDKNQAIEYVNEIRMVLGGLPEPIPIFRAISATNEEQIDKENPGIYWSFEKDNAITFGKRNGSNFLLSGTIASKYVDWEETIRAYVINSDLTDGDSEFEINVKDDTKINIIKIEKIKYKS